ncbi:30S ribosomal protein S3, partial [Peptoniphilus senegalensis]
MGQKVNPHGLRVGVIKDWDSKWYADKKNFADLLVEDNNIRKYVKKKLYTAGISKIEIERAANRVKVSIYTAKPGMVIGRGGAGVEELRAEIEKLTDKSVVINVEEIKNQDLDAQIVAETIAESLERRVAFRRAMKQAIQR